MLGGDLLANRREDVLNSSCQSKRLPDLASFGDETFLERTQDGQFLGGRILASPMAATPFRRNVTERFPELPRESCSKARSASRWRFFQGLQERICRLLLHSVGIVNNCNLATRDQRLALNGMLKITDLVDHNAARLRFRLHHMEVGVSNDASRLTLQNKRGHTFGQPDLPLPTGPASR